MSLDLDRLPEEELGSWGMLQRARCRVLRPRSREELVAQVAELSCRERPFALRGGGNSYGDPAQLDGGFVLDLSGLDAVLDWQPEQGRISVEPGLSFEGLWRRVLPEGWWPAVSPGTMKVTMGGAAAFDVHGKNHFRAGSFRDHVLGLELLTPAGETLHLSRQHDPDLFAAVLGCGGLLGIITRLDLRLHRLHGGRVAVRPLAVASFEEMVTVFEREIASVDYAVGWHDLLAAGEARGRGIIHLARYPEAGEDPEGEAYLDPARHALPARLFGIWPMAWLWPLLGLTLNVPGMRLVNALKMRSGRRAERRGEFLEPLALFHYLLDQVPNWKRAYRPGGLIQFQSFVPVATAAETFMSLAGICHRHGMPPFLCVTKRHRETDALIGYARDGYSQALDIRVAPGHEAAVERLCRELEERVFAAGGALYLAKDAMLRPSGLRAFLDADRLDRLAALKRRLDPAGLLRSDQAARLEIP
ncbi:MAG: FAD-binding oxidoreductase [Planctomycetes bacterium]|nr:FAD-binding oxidoreductase [Planctomycetota bacterium]